MKYKAVDKVYTRAYDQYMRRTADEGLTPRVIPLLNACPKCGGHLKALVLVGLGICRPKKQACVNYCGFEKDIAKEQHGK